MKKRYFKLVFTVILFLAISTLLKAETVKITIPAELEVSSSQVILGDIAILENISQEQFLELSSIELISSLLPGYSRRIYKNQIILLLENKGVQRSDIVLEIPDIINVKRKKNLLDKEFLLAEASKFIRSQFDYSDKQIEIRPRFIPPEIILSDEEFEIQFSIPGRNTNRGNISLQVRILIDELVHRQFYMSFDLKIYEDVYIAKRPISVGEKINKEDFYQEFRGLTDFHGVIIKDLDNTLVKDGIVNIAIPREGVLTTYHLVLPIIVSPSDILQAEIVSGGIRVRTQVIARQSGRKGEYITVENINTKHRFKAQIISSHLVRLVY